MEVAEAINIAIDYVKKLFSGGTDYRLEEVELRDDGSFDVTVSYRIPGQNAVFPMYSGNLYSGNRAAIGIDPDRQYKVVAIERNGNVKSVRMRQIMVG